MDRLRPNPRRMAIAMASVLLLAAAGAASGARAGDGHGEVPSPERRMIEAIDWIAANSVLTMPDRLPGLRFVAPDRMAGLRVDLAGPGHAVDAATGPGPGDGAGDDIVAFYVARSATIYLPAGWTGASAVEMSVLVHEMVHHMEAVMTGGGAGDERLAYLLQDRWLQAHGSSLEQSFGIDPFSRAMLTEWLY